MAPRTVVFVICALAGVQAASQDHIAEGVDVGRHVVPALVVVPHCCYHFFFVIAVLLWLSLELQAAVPEI